MEQINQLIQVVDQLLGPNGCPWDQKQTLATIRQDLLEEAHEVIDAIDSQNPESITEELGDLLFVVLFLSRLAEKEKKGTLKKIAEGITEKMIRRHPHVFEERKDLTHDQHLEQWDAIKKKEKKVVEHPLKRIPKSLPTLTRAMEIAKACKKHEWELKEIPINDAEEEVGNAIFILVQEATKKGIHPELALKKVLAQHEAYL